MISFLNDKKAMLDFERNLDKEIDKVVSMMSRLRIRSVVLSGDSSPHDAVFVGAAKRLNVPSVVLSHGYVNSKYLLSIAPITADKIVVWTRMQKNEIRNVLNEFQASKVKYLG